MNQQLLDKTIEISKSLVEIPDSKNKHFSFIVFQGKILSIGWNHGWRTHPIARKLGYRFDAIHSELDSIIGYRGEEKRLKKCTLINVRVNRFGELGMSKPCPNCLNLLSEYRFKDIYYTNFDGQFTKLAS
jgi:deoxycytidylate deaminase